MRIVWTTAAAAALLLLLSGPALADTIHLGLSSSTGRDGTGSLAFVDGTAVETEIHVTPGTPGDSSVAHYDGDYTLDASATKYDLHGYAEWHDPGSGTTAARAGSFFRDELYFVTENAEAATITFEFSVDVEMGGTDPSFILSWGYYSATGALVASFDVFETTSTYDGTVSLTSVSGADTYVFDSGTYIPFSVGAWGYVDAQGDYVDWEHTITLQDVKVYQDGSLLGADEYTLTALSGSPAFPGSTPVPEPGTLALLALGLGGIVVGRRKRQRRTA